MIPFYLLVGIMPLVRHWLWSETQIAGLTLVKILGIVCLLSALFTLASRSTAPRFLETIQSRLFLVFGLLTMASFVLFGPTAVEVEVSPMGNWTSFLLLFFVTVVLVDSVDTLRLVALSLMGGVAFAATHLIREWIGFGGAAGARPGWVTGDPNYFALSALLCMPLSLLMALQPRPLWERLYCWGCLVLTLLAFFLAGSRGGFLGLLVTFVAVAWRSRHRRRILAVGLVTISVMLVALPTSPLTRMLEPDRGDVQSNDVRTALFWAGLTMFEQNVWTGIGVGNFKNLVGAYAAADEQLENVAHNTYLEIAAEMGIFGLVAFLGIMFWSLRTLRLLRMQMANGSASVAYAAVHGFHAALLGASVSLFFLSALHVRILWFVVIISTCLPRLVREDAEAASSATPSAASVPTPTGARRR